MILKYIFLIFCLAKINLCQKVRYDKYRLVSITPVNERNLRFLAKLEDELDVDFWNHLRGVNDNLLVLLSPQAFKKYEKIFNQRKISFKVVIDDMQRNIDLESNNMIRPRNQSINIAGKYVSFDAINNYLLNIEQKNSYARIYIPGKTVEGRDIPVLRLNTGKTNRSIWIDCGIHAREWVSISTCIWIIERLVIDYNMGNKTVVDLLNYYDVHIMPVHNPDGYIYSMTRDRYWRKNRSTNRGILISYCHGVDLNRNYGYKWFTGGSSGNVCSETYAGPYAESEPETMAVKSAIKALDNKWDAYVTFHAFGQYFFTPYGYTYSLPSDYDDQLKVANITADAMKLVFGTTYRVGSTSNLLYIASGCSQDWAYGEAGIKYSYTIELRPDINDIYTGFLYPESESSKVGEESYQGMLTLMKTIKNQKN